MILRQILPKTDRNESRIMFNLIFFKPIMHRLDAVPNVHCGRQMTDIDKDLFGLPYANEFSSWNI